MAAIWERNQGAEPVSYLREMLTHQLSLYGLLGSLALGTLLAFPYGFGVAAIPVLCFAACEAIAALFVPSSSFFRNQIDRKKRQERREQARAHLLHEIRRRVAEDPLWELYHSLCERLVSLRQIARNRKTSLTESDVERLDDATVDFLGLWLGRLTMMERLETIDESDLKAKLKAVSAQLEAIEAHANRRHLEQAKADLERILTRRERLLARQAAVEAATLALADAFDELYQAVMTNPTSGDIGRQLQESVERLHIEEDLDLDLEDNFEAGGSTPGRGLRLKEPQHDRDQPGRTAKALRLRTREPRG
jgi:hypothetical protein